MIVLGINDNHDASAALVVDGEVAAVAWDADTFTGSVVSPQYNEGAEACWDADQLNEDCE